MKKLLCVVLAAMLVISLLPLTVSAEAKSVEEFGWETDEDSGIKDYTGWTSEDGVTITATAASATENNRIWKHLIEDEDNFSVSVDYNADANSSGYIKILGNTVELDGRHGNGNQVYLKLNGNGQDWITCANCDCNVHITRKDGGDLTIVIAGSVTKTLPFAESSTNVELGLYAGTVVFGNVTVTEPTDPVVGDKTPADYGWQTDSYGSYNGWTAPSEDALTADYSKATGDRRVWKSFIEDEANWEVSLTYKADTASSGYIKLQGNRIELDSRNGNGDELSLKVNDSQIGWVPANGREAIVSVTCTNGTIALTVAGKSGGTEEITLSKRESNNNLELGVYAGKVYFSDIKFEAADIGGGEKTPGDFGWKTDNGASFAGWTAASGTEMSVDFAATDGEHRIWKNITEDDNNFVITLDYQAAEASSGYVKIFGSRVEMDSRNGNGDELFIKINDGEGEWTPAVGAAAKVELSRKNGGNITVKINDYEATMPAKENNNNFELGVYEGKLSFANIKATKLDPGDDPVDPPSGEKTPGDFGWKTDDTADFSGWTATDEQNFSADHSKTIGNHRIWKELTDGWNNVYIMLTYTGSSTSSAYFKIMGNTIELDGRNGKGDELYVKINGQGNGWVKCADCKATVLFQRGSSGNIKVTITGSGNAEPMSFEVMPADVNPNFEIGTYAGVCSFAGVQGGKQAVSFVDVTAKDWFFSAVNDAVALGLFSGVGDNKFEPKTQMTRAMIVQVLYSMEGSPAVEGSLKFTDTKDGKWYSPAVLWASQNGVVSGYDTGAFGVNDPITREQIAVVLYNYAALKGMDISAKTDLGTFSDGGKVSSWARNAMQWLVAIGCISGKQNGGKTLLDPKGNTTRAEAASMMVRFVGYLDANTAK